MLVIGLVAKVVVSGRSGLSLLEFESDSHSLELVSPLELDPLESIPFEETGEGTFFILLIPLLINSKQKYVVVLS